MALINLANINSSGNIKTENTEVTYTTNGEYTVEPTEEADAIKDLTVHIGVPGGQELVWDIDGMRYYGSKITEFPKWYRFSLRTGSNCVMMFYQCRSLTSLDLSSFDTSKVTDMISMFCDCHSLTSLDLSSFDTSKVTGMSYMFYQCRSLTSLDLSSFDTSKVTGMSYMFYDCSSLTSLDLSSFDTSNVTGMNNMFRDCRSLTSLDLSSFDTSSLASYELGTNNMFYNCIKLKTLTKGSFKNLKFSLDLSPCVVLSKQSVVDLFDSIGTTKSGATITLASAVYSQLSKDEIKVATDKGWTVVSK